MPRPSVKSNLGADRKVYWFCSAGDVAYFGPFDTQVEAWDTLRLTKEERARQNRAHPQGAYVWCSYNKNPMEK